MMAQGRHEEAIVEAEKSLALNPSAIEGYMAIATANNFLARPDRSLEMIEKATRLSPRDPFLCGVLFDEGRGLFHHAPGRERDRMGPSIAGDWPHTATPMER